MLVNRLSAVADVGDGTDDEEGGEAIEAEDFAGDEDGCPECIACACEHGGEAECCGEGDGHPEHACDEDSEGSADGEKRGDDTANESCGECKNCESEFQNPVVPGDVLNQVGGSGGTPRSIPGGSSYNIRGIPNQVCIPGDSKAHIQQVCSKSGVAALEKDEQENAESGTHNRDALDGIRKFLCKEVLRESEQLCESATDDAK